MALHRKRHAERRRPARERGELEGHECVAAADRRSGAARDDLPELLEFGDVRVAVAFRVALRQRRARAAVAEELGAPAPLAVSAPDRAGRTDELGIALESVAGAAADVD